MTISAPSGIYVGCNHDTDPIPLSATGLPAGGSYGWAVAPSPGTGGGTFSDAGSADTTFTGSARGKLDAQVTYTLPSGVTCRDKVGLVVIEIGDIPEDVEDQYMDEFDVTNSGQYTVSYSDSGGELRGVYISPMLDPDSPYQ